MIDPDEEIARLAADWIGLDADSVGRATIERARRKRQTQINVLTPSLYIERVKRDLIERDALIEELVVHDSWFFREPAAFAWLTAFARGLAAERPTSRPLRLLSIPAARGEEPYSMASALRDAGLPSSRIAIDGYDVSLPTIDAAREAVYSQVSLRGTSPELRDRLFQPVGNNWRLRDEVRPLVRFAQGNVLHAELPGGRPPYDVIFCRNLIIYLREDARAAALANFARWLAPGGRLVLGSSESLGASQTAFTATNEASFVYRLANERAGGQTGWKPYNGQGKSPGDKTHHIKPDVAPRAPQGDALHGMLAAQTNGANGSPPTPSKATKCPSRPLLDAAAEAANRRDYPAAIARVQEAIRQTPSSPDAYFLMGSIRLATGDAEQAEQALGRAVYLDPQHADALLSLALLAEQRGAARAAAAFRRRAAQAHSGGPR